MQDCKVDICDRESSKRGYCKSHYDWAWRRDFEQEPTHKIGETEQQRLAKESKRKCAECENIKNLTRFPTNRSYPQNKAYRCYNCYRKRNKESVRKIRKRRLRIIRSIKNDRGCSKCDEDDPRALLFHHVDPKQKEFNVNSTNILRKWEDIQKEIKKCEVMCANCHRKHHSSPLLQGPQHE